MGCRPSRTEARPGRCSWSATRDRPCGSGSQTSVRPGGHLLIPGLRTVLTRVADQVGARAVYPFDRPYLPFQRWSMRAEPCHPSPIGMLIHPEFGLWHALRGALLFTREISIPEVARFPSPCDSCQDRPCLTACPATAFSPTTGYDVPRCVGHLGRPAGQDCIDIGCRARRACPVGGSYRYAAEHARFHMEAFLANAGRPG